MSATRPPVPELAGTRTHENLRAAWARDAQVGRLWEFFARVAEIEGHAEIARAFRELAESEQVVVHGHLDLLLRVGEPLGDVPVGETARNLRAAAQMQAEHASETLPDMARTARAEGFPDVASWFESVALARAAHAARLGALDDGGAR